MKLEDILIKAHELFHKYAIKSITMDDVARELGISKKTLYQFIMNKKELIEKVIAKEVETSTAKHEAIKKLNLNPIEELFEFSKMMNELLKTQNPALIYDLRKYHPSLFNKISEIKRQKAYESVLANLKNGIKDGFYRKEINPDIIAKIYVSRIEHNYDQSIFSISEITSMDVFNEILIYHLHGICNSEGLKILNKKLDEFKNQLI
ncbi:MAG: TetR/AcrR family transcriptional regulator [Bacteroidales bacterium]|nr:TetR/AcrR family transcriptional regulator [Bacteroidales bacterium]MBN2756915.1 TetR/AcrR family transcriptional regulator [Bacteroidales bacterium]